MNYQNMTLEEVMRVAVPSTDLEKAIFAKLDLDRPVDEEFEELQRECDSKDDEIDDMRSIIREMEDEISSALQSIADGNADKASQILKAI